MAEKIELNNQIVDLLCDLSRLIRSGMSFSSGGRQLTLHQVQTILYVAEQKEVKMVNLAKKFNITRPSTTVLINSLVKNGYLKRTTGKEDKREVKVSVAEKGQRFIKKAQNQRSTKINYILSYVTEQDKKKLTKILQTIVERLKSEYEN